MNNRSKDIRQIRPAIPSAIVDEATSTAEQFQNISLRPIIKFQHPLLIQIIKHYLVKKKNVFFKLNLEARQNYLDQILSKDLQLRNEIKGSIIGLFTVEEYEAYILNATSLNKRMMNIVKERLLSHIQEFDKKC